MTAELKVVESTVLTQEEKAELDQEIDRIIAAHKDNRQEINRLVFESVSAMTEADDAQSELSNKGFFKRLWGGISGSNQRLQNKINSNRAAAQYASQQTLEKLAEQNLMTFDLIAAVNNKMNASLTKVDEEFTRIYDGLGKFFKANRNEMVRLETRLEKVERNVNLLTWQNSIEYQDFNGTDYTDLDDITKIVCLTRDFYDITKGNWNTSDLLLLKAAMSTVDISPKEKVNYFDTIETIAHDDILKDKLLGGCILGDVPDPSYLISIGCLKKFETLDNEEDYVVDTIVDYMGQNGLEVKRNKVCSDLTSKYLANKACVDVNMDVDSYDLILDLLYNLKQSSDEKVVKLSDALIEEEAKKKEKAEEEAKKKAEEDAKKAEEEAKKKAEEDAKKAESLLEQGESYDDLKLNNPNLNYKKAYECYKAAADLGNMDAVARIGRLYLDGNGVEKNLKTTITLLKKAANAGSARGQNTLGYCYECGLGVEYDIKEAIIWYRKAATQGYATAQANLGLCYENGKGVEYDIEEAVKWYRKAAVQGFAQSQYNLGRCYENGVGVEYDIKEAVKWYRKAAVQEYEDAKDRLYSMGVDLEDETIDNSGMAKDDHIIRITSPVDGRATKIKAEDDDYVDKGDLLAVIKSDAGGRSYDIKAPCDGKVVDVNVYKNDWVGEGELLFKLDDRY